MLNLCHASKAPINSSCKSIELIKQTSWIAIEGGKKGTKLLQRDRLAWRQMKRPQIVNQDSKDSKVSLDLNSWFKFNKQHVIFAWIIHAYPTILKKLCSISNMTLVYKSENHLLIWNQRSHISCSLSLVMKHTVYCNSKSSRIRRSSFSETVMRSHENKARRRIKSKLWHKAAERAQIDNFCQNSDL